MINKKKIIEIVSKYGFEEVPCAIPKNNFQYFKIGIYFKIYEISPKLFYFLRDKVSPIKFSSEDELINNLDKNIQNFPELKGKKRKFLLDQLC